MPILRKIVNLRNLIVLAVIVGVVLMFRAWSARAEIELEREWGVPIIVSPSVQPVQGQVLLFKATNISTTRVSVRLTLYNDREGFPVVSEEFPDITTGKTVTYVYNPPPGKLTINQTTLEVPDAVRAVVGPVHEGEPGAVRRVAASLQLMRLQSTPGNASPSLDPPIIVPLERCLFTPRGYLPHYTDGRLVWDCGPVFEEQ